MSYIKSEGGPPNVRRAEDGPIGFKHKFTEWPNAKGHSTSPSKTKASSKPHTKAVSKGSPSGKASGGGKTSGSKGK